MKIHQVLEHVARHKTYRRPFIGFDHERKMYVEISEKPASFPQGVSHLANYLDQQVSKRLPSGVLMLAALDEVHLKICFDPREITEESILDWLRNIAFI